MLSPFGPFNQSVGGGGVGGAGGAVPFWPIQSVGGGGIYVNFCFKGAIQSQRGVGGAMAPLPPLWGRL